MDKPSLVSLCNEKFRNSSEVVVISVGGQTAIEVVDGRIYLTSNLITDIRELPAAEGGEPGQTDGAGASE